ncbi:hypothetical protein [Salinicola sp. MH3R3-1]|uniref:hypothetical protein n=1 Tax=Salinicola sp. MH3R3-1 TaxID=1928762 RepID=UPI001AF00E0D|nr:hypothetical protein [Salinicola sp. MH3R3-1]
MSQEAIFIELIIAILHTEKGRYTASLIDIEEAKRTESFRLVETTRQDRWRREVSTLPGFSKRLSKAFCTPKASPEEFQSGR